MFAGAAIKEEARAKAEEEGLPDYEEEILKTMAKRGHQPNISFFAFTATPKYKTLEVFGTPGADGKPNPFHLYSMRQAIDEEFILDVLQNYTTYKTYYRLIKSIEDDPQVDKRKAARALARFMSLHPHNIAQKTEVMVEHLRHFTMHKIGGKAKAMVVTSSRLHAVRYKQAFDKYIEDKGYAGIKTLVGTGVARGDEIELSKLIDILNERFGTDFRPGDQLFFESIREDAVSDSNLRQAALANTMENFGYVFRNALEGLFIDRMDQNEEITAKFMNEDHFREAVSKHLLKEVYEKIREEAEVANDE